MELIQGSETSANYNLTPGKYPEENIQESYNFIYLKRRYFDTQEPFHRSVAPYNCNSTSPLSLICSETAKMTACLLEVKSHIVLVAKL